MVPGSEEMLSEFIITSCYHNFVPGLVGKERVSSSVG